MRAHHRLGFSLVASLWAAAAFGQTATLGLQEAVLKARTQPTAPRTTPPAWMDYAKVQAGYAFLDAHGDFAGQIMGTSSLAATFAARDITPVIMETGRLPKDFNQRMKETGEWMQDIFDAPKDREDFVGRNYAKAVALGRLHSIVGETVAEELKWDPKERVVMNGQAVALVLYTFAWWPVEAMEATKQIDPAKDAEGLAGWFHLWSTIGYAMGVPEDLLPKDYATAQKTVALLREAQYAKPGEKLPDGIPVLMGGHMRMVAGMAYRQAEAQAKAKGGTLPAGVTPAALMPDAAKGFAGLLALSPGLVEALGLGPDPVAKLLEYAAMPPPK